MFRDYSKDRHIQNHYRLLRENQTHEYATNMIRKYCDFNKNGVIMDIWDVVDDLTNFVDVSDPDITLANAFHAYQTAEGARKDGREDWFQLTCFLHDLGKIMYKKGCDEDGTSQKYQWGIVGDTFITGCRLPDETILPEFNSLNPDMTDGKITATANGIYEEGCGLDNCVMSWGHDEYMYRVLKYNNVNLPEEALYIIRYHSLYPWHHEGCYQHLESSKDKEMKHWVEEFNKYDLYTKEDVKYDDDELDKMKIYYDRLIMKWLGRRDLVW